jgi:hypothetical protein
MKKEPLRPQGSIELGPESLLQMTMSAAARYYGVSENVVGKRLRPTDRLDVAQLNFAMA